MPITDGVITGEAAGPSSNNASARRAVQDRFSNGAAASTRSLDGHSRSAKLQSVLDAVQAPPPSNFLTVEVLFGAVHVIALTAAVYACAYTARGFDVGDAPEAHGDAPEAPLACFPGSNGLVWKPMALLKMGYPMVPVILGCWVVRACERRSGGGRKMTAGYYFNNLKMGLLPSLGYGFMVNFVLKYAITKMARQQVLPPILLDMLGPASWVFGVLCWGGVSFLIDTGEEARRPDFGFYPRWRVERRRREDGGAAPVEDIVHKGPHMFFRVIPTPIHGTLKKVLYASLARMVGITLLACILWFSGVLLCLLNEGVQDYWLDLDEGGSAWKVILCTDMLNLIVNTFTAPLLIRWGWRSEPGVRSGALLARTLDEPLPLDDEAAERAELLRELWADLA